MIRQKNKFRLGKAMLIAGGLMLSGCVASAAYRNEGEITSEQESVSDQESALKQESALNQESVQMQDVDADKDEVRIELTPDVHNKIYGSFDSLEEMNETLTKQLAERLLKEGRIKDEKQLFLAESKLNVIFVDEFGREIAGEVEVDCKYSTPYDMKWVSVSDGGKLCYYDAKMDYYLVSEPSGDGKKVKIVIKDYRDQINEKTANVKMANTIYGDWRNCFDEIVSNWEKTSSDKLEKLQDPITACEVLYNLENGYGEFHEYDEKSGVVLYRLNDGGKIYFEMYYDGCWKPERCTDSFDLTANERKKAIQKVTAKELKESEERRMLTNEYSWNELTGYYRPICQRDDLDACLYGVNGGDSMILRVGNEVYPLDIGWAMHYNDYGFSIMDCDQDGQDEFVFIHNIGGGTGRYADSLQVIDIIDGKARISEFQCDEFYDQLRAAAPKGSTFYDIFHYTVDGEKLLYRFSVKDDHWMVIGQLTGEILYHEDGSFSISLPEYEVDTEESQEKEEENTIESDSQMQKETDSIKILAEIPDRDICVYEDAKNEDAIDGYSAFFRMGDEVYPLDEYWSEDERVESFSSGDFDGDGQEEFALISSRERSDKEEFLLVLDIVDGKMNRAYYGGIPTFINEQLPGSCGAYYNSSKCKVNGDSFIYSWPVKRKNFDGKYLEIGRVEANMKYEKDGELHIKKCDWIITDQSNVDSLLMEIELDNMTADELRKITKHADEVKMSDTDRKQEGVVIIDEIPELDICLYSMSFEGERCPSVLRYGNGIYFADIPSWSESIEHHLICSKANRNIWYVERKNQDGYECESLTGLYNTNDRFDKTCVDVDDMPYGCEKGDFRIRVDDNYIFYDLCVVNKKDKSIVGHYSGMLENESDLHMSFMESIYHENIDNDTVALVDDPEKEICLYGKKTAKGNTTVLKVGDNEYDLQLDWLEMYPDLTVQAGDFDKDGQTEYAIIGRELTDYLPKASLCVVEINKDKAEVHVCDVRKCALDQRYVSAHGSHYGEGPMVSGFYAEGDSITYEYHLYWYSHEQGVIRGDIIYQDNGEIAFDQGEVVTDIGQG